MYFSVMLSLGLGLEPCGLVNITGISRWIYSGDKTFRLRGLYNCDTSTIRVRFERDKTSYEELCAFEQ